MENAYNIYTLLKYASYKKNPLLQEPESAKSSGWVHVWHQPT